MIYACTCVYPVVADCIGLAREFDEKMKSPLRVRVESVTL